MIDIKCFHCKTYMNKSETSGFADSDTRLYQFVCLNIVECNYNNIIRFVLENKKYYNYHYQIDNDNYLLLGKDYKSNRYTKLYSHKTNEDLISIDFIPLDINHDINDQLHKIYNNLMDLIIFI